jgi:hypothetical protein
VTSARDRPAGLSYGDFVPGGPSPFGPKAAPPPPDPEALLAAMGNQRMWWSGMLEEVGMGWWWASYRALVCGL